MILAACLLSLVAMATAAPGASLPNQPPRCCLGDKFELNFVDTKKFGSGDLEVTRMSTDSTAKKTVQMVSTLVPGQDAVFKYRVVTDYNKQKVYVVLPDNSCTSQDYTGPFLDSCGSHFNETLLASTYIGKDPAMGAVMVASLPYGDQATLTTVLDKDCIPITQYLKGKIGGYDVDTTQFFTGFTAGIADPTIFNLPVTCPP